jgi:hypothetical protein
MTYFLRLGQNYQYAEPLIRIYDVGDEILEIWVYRDKETDLHLKQDTFVCLVNMETHSDGYKKELGLALQQTDDGQGLYKRVGVAANIPERWIESVEPMEIVIV